MATTCSSNEIVHVAPKGGRNLVSVSEMAAGHFNSAGKWPAESSPPVPRTWLLKSASHVSSANARAGRAMRPPNPARSQGEGVRHAQRPLEVHRGDGFKR